VEGVIFNSGKRHASKQHTVIIRVHYTLLLSLLGECLPLLTQHHFCNKLQYEKSEGHCFGSMRALGTRWGVALAILTW